ncbi:MAG TPA: hypothetical protein EYO58_03460 [Flavobacteriales bacterium]|nr:hypothetical protein [Flavobacteriales bacterium]HIB76677.1 hypothetical protein [Flavobacteriales bacterium]
MKCPIPIVVPPMLHPLVYHIVVVIVLLVAVSPLALALERLGLPVREGIALGQCLPDLVEELRAAVIRVVKRYYCKYVSC